MKLNTPMPLSHPKKKISLGDKILTIGSCFSDNIGNSLLDNKFDTLVNPFGTIFDPLSIIRLLTYSLNKVTPPAETYIFSQGVYKNLELHSSFTGLSKDELALKINARLSSTNELIKSADWLIISLGTAHIYRYKKTDHYVANCQKLPATEFSKELVEIGQLQKNFQSLIDLLVVQNPNLKIILTVSPIRHISDGLAANSISKAILRQLCHNLSANHTSVDYYPAFEIMMDDLRDYRFYKEDMIHPTEQAVRYIWQHFTESYMDEAATGFLIKWGDIKRALQHRPFNPATPEHQVFLKKTLKKLTSLPEKIDIAREIEQIKKQLIED